MNIRLSAVLLLVLAMVTGVTIAPGAVAADSTEEEGFLSSVYDVVEDENGNGIKADDAAARYIEESLAGFSRVSWSIKRTYSDPESTAAEEAAAVQSTFDAHNSSIQTWVNARTDASTEHDTTKVQISIDGETATRYITANVSGGNYTALQMSESIPESRSVDDTTHVCGYAAENANSELEAFVEAYVETGEDPSQEHLAKMKGKYEPDTESTLLPTDGECEVSD